MRKILSRRLVLMSALFALTLVSGAFAQTRRARTSTYRTRNLIIRLDTKTAQFRSYTQASIDRSPINGSNREDRIAEFITDFESAATSLRQDYDARRDVTADVQEVLNRALFIDRFMARNRLSSQSVTQWSSIRSDLNTLASIYNVSWNWNRVPEYPNTGNGGYPDTNNPNRGYPDANYPNGGYPGGRGTGRGFDSRLTGTYRLNHSQSDDINTILDRANIGGDVAQQDRMRQNLERRLTPPEMIAITKTGRTVSLASTLAPQVTFDADGVAKSETTRNGRTIRTTASANADSLLISYVGDRTNDFYLTFAPTRDGQLRVTRKLYIENRNETVSISSVYDKTNAVADWSIVNTGAPYTANTTTVGTYQEFYIPNGTRLTTRLNNLVNTQATQVGDRFTMEVISPDQYRGAIIDGRVANAEGSGRVTGRASLGLDFDTIRMPNGSTYRFTGIIDSVRSANGDNIRVNNEGTVRDSNQTTKTATRAGIGAALGALIGAIAGGGEGAAVGAVVGAGAGAGTVFIQGRDNLELAQGTEFGITATAPANVRYVPNN